MVETRCLLLLHLMESILFQPVKKMSMFGTIIVRTKHLGKRKFGRPKVSSLVARQ